MPKNLPDHFLTLIACSCSRRRGGREKSIWITHTLSTLRKFVIGQLVLSFKWALATGSHPQWLSIYPVVRRSGGFRWREGGNRHSTLQYLMRIRIPVGGFRLPPRFQVTIRSPCPAPLLPRSCSSFFFLVAVCSVASSFTLRALCSLNETPSHPIHLSSGCRFSLDFFWAHSRRLPLSVACSTTICSVSWTLLEVAARCCCSSRVELHALSSCQGMTSRS